MLSFIDIYNRLNAIYGPLNWWPGETPFEVMIGAVLTQNTSWENVERAIKNLKPMLDPESMHKLDNESLAELIRPAGYYNIKAKYIKALLDWYKTLDYDIKKLKSAPLSELRQSLLAVRGIGKETADSILLYAAGKPIFVVDAYTRRLFSRLGYSLPKKYDDVRCLFEIALPTDSGVYNQYHALIVHHCKLNCRSVPKCEGCELGYACVFSNK